MNKAPEAIFLPTADGERFCIHRAPAGAERSATVFVHAWAEEMNKARRMVNQQARALAQAGHAVLQIDLHGCGDSSGDFSEATWDGWIDDIVLAMQWMRDRHDAPLRLWGLRAGCLLAVQAAARTDEATDLLFWQPALTGRMLLQQFLRLRLAAELQHGGGKGLIERLKRDLDAGRCVDVAGYTLSPALASGLDRATLDLPPRAGHVAWLELNTRADAELLPASAERLAAWRAAGHSVAAKVVHGPAFWQTQEIEDAPELLTATMAMLHEPELA